MLVGDFPSTDKIENKGTIIFKMRTKSSCLLVLPASSVSLRGDFAPSGACRNMSVGDFSSTDKIKNEGAIIF
jgi:hypothetical protein